MTESEIREKAEAEQNKITELLHDFNISDKRMKLLEPIIANTAWMKVKLDDARDAVKNSSIAITYDNGGGQKGIRENPLFKGYESLWKSYMTGMSKILDCLPDDVAEIASEFVDKPKTVLDLVRGKHEQVAI